MRKRRGKERKENGNGWILNPQNFKVRETKIYKRRESQSQEGGKGLKGFLFLIHSVETYTPPRSIIWLRIGLVWFRPSFNSSRWTLLRDQANSRIIITHSLCFRLSLPRLALSLVSINHATPSHRQTNPTAQLLMFDDWYILWYSPCNYIPNVSVTFLG